MNPGHAGKQAPPPARRARRGDLAIEHRADVSADLVATAIARHQANDRLGRDACEKWGPGSSLSRVELAEGGAPCDWAVKLHRWRGLRGALSDGWRGSRAVRARGGLARLTLCGVDSPALVAIAERRRAGIVLESWVLSEFRADAQPLPVALANESLERDDRRALLAALGDLVGALHAAGVDHPDLKPSNLLVGSAGALALLDLDALVPPRRLTWRRRVRALGQLEAYARDLHPWLSRTDRARVLRAYLVRNPSLHGERRRLAEQAVAWAERRVAEWSRRDRGERRAYPLAPRPAPAPPRPTPDSRA
jgi:hypothetical protein